MIPLIYIYDLAFLVLFTLFVVIFLYKKRKNLKKDGIMYLYRTKIGIRLINYFGGKYKKTITVFSILAVISGYILMITALYLFLYEFVYVYLFNPSIVRAIKVPPIFPLVPYLPELFQIKFLKPFYFTYWIVAIAVIAVFHEFAHGIVARRYGIKIKTTGFGFLGPFLAAFVEPDEKQMKKKPKFQQISVLAAGTFTNLILAGIFFLLLVLFFSLTYVPSGASFNIYTPNLINTTAITVIGGVNANNLNNTELLNFINTKKIDNNFVSASGEKLNLTTLKVDNSTYYIGISNLKEQLKAESGLIYLYEDLPAVKSGLKGAIVKIDNNKISTYSDLSVVMSKYSPGDKIKLETKSEGKTYVYDITLAQDSQNKTRAVIGIGYLSNSRSGFLGKIYNLLNMYQKPGTYYEPRFNADLVLFIYNLIWWLALINLSVALVNMIPMGIFDGGAMFMLTVWGITGNKRYAEIAFKFVTYLLLAALLVVMVAWAVAVF
ncbi:Peptidase family M50 [uncultured archaeon]|nr:Peptidase family M50 [uncultured archaeon]